MRAESIFLGCDIGTGSCKILACDSSGTIHAESQSFYQPQHPCPGYSVEDPDVIKKAFVHCVHDILKKIPHPAGIGFSSCMHSLIPVDKQCRPLAQMLTWEDNRSYEIAKSIRGTDIGNGIYSRTGTPIHSMSPLCKVRWLRENETECFDRVFKFIGIKEYLWHWMFGVYEVDYSIASAMGMFDIIKLKWDEEALAFCGITTERLSNPVDTLHHRNEPTDDFLNTTGLPAGLTYCIGASDGCMANVGGGVDSADKAALTIGTSGAVRITGGKPVVDSGSMIFNYLLDSKTFVSGGPVNNGGNVLRLLFRMILSKDHPTDGDFQMLDDAVTKIPPGADGLLCIPWFYGERAPVWDEKATGAWFGITNDHTQYHLIRAAMEGVCFTLRKILSGIESLSEKIDTLYAGGGFIHSEPWVKMMADITGKRIVIRTEGDVSAFGAAMWLMKSMKKRLHFRSHPDDKIVLPDRMNDAVYEKHYQIFQRLYEQTKEQMGLLHP